MFEHTHVNMCTLQNPLSF